MKQILNEGKYGQYKRLYNICIRLSKLKLMYNSKTLLKKNYIFNIILTKY